eukprot:6115980-Alexandrium_andersonii.AAC.1
MSASLVGSEMCIRDRLARLRGSRPRAHFLQLRRGQEPRGEGFLSPLVPVSYTHLTLPTICSV